MSFPKSALYRAPRKYPHGEKEPVKTIEEFLKAVERRRYFFIGRSKRPVHWGWAGNLPVSRLAYLIKTEGVRLAVRNPDSPYVFDVYLHDGVAEGTAKGAWGQCDELPGGIITAKSEQGLRRSCRTKLLSFCYDVPHESIKIEFRIHQ